MLAALMACPHKKEGQTPAEVGGMWPLPKDAWTPRSWKRQEGLPPYPPESIQRDGDAAHTLMLDFWLQDCEKTFPLFKPTPFVAL